MKKQIKSFLRSIRSLYFRMKTKQYKHIKYSFFPNPKSKVWIISFAGFPGFGKSPVYNYMKTLHNLRVNKLFLLDDFGYSEALGSYYLGENGNWFLPQEIPELLRLLQAGQDDTITITVGSSKGGTSALYYALLCQAQYAVIGAPQYHIGDYLKSPAHRPMLKAICGSDSEEAIAMLNRLVPEAIHNYGDAEKPTVFVHYSPNEHTYPEHIKDMILDLKENGFPVEEDGAYSYTQHSDVAKIFPNVLLNKVKEIIRAHGENA